jgi:ligand-binding sensor domain-containing protein
VFNPKTNQFKHYFFYADSARDQLSSSWVFDILVDRDKGVWAATSNGLNYLKGKKDKFEILH